MAITTDSQTMVHNTTNRRHHRQQRRPRSNSTASDSSSSSSSSMDDSIGSFNNHNHHQCRQRRNNTNGSNRRRNNHKKNGKKGPSRKEQSPLTMEQQAQYVALDCEMVGVGEGGVDSSLARVTLVGWNGTVLLDAYVKQTRPVSDYRTFVSGITPADLEETNQTKNLWDKETCRTKVMEILEGKILVGHALKNDLLALDIRHPWYMIRDTARYEPFMQARAYDGLLCPRKLKDLAQTRLNGREIQVYGKPHCPVEDAVTALDLYKTVRDKWEAVMEYKINRTKEIMKEQQQRTALAEPVEQQQPVALAA